VDQESGAVEAVVKKIWTGRRVYVTGHTGFKGGWLCMWLAQMGATVRGYSLGPPTDPSLFEVARISTLVVDERGDVRDFDHLSRSLREFAPEVVFHLAAQPLVRASYEDPLGTYATNVMGTASLLESVRKVDSVRAVVVVTTDKCYENREWVWSYRESDRLGGHDPYSSSKACAELLTASYRDSFFSASSGGHVPAVATARAGNVIGGGDWSQDRLVPDLIRGFISGKSVAIRYPNSIRPWQHVLEPVGGYLLLAAKLLNRGEDLAQAWNFGPREDDAWSVARIADEMARRWGAPAKWNLDGNDHPHEARSLKLDASRATAILGWRARLNLEQSIEMTVDWYKQWRTGGDMLSFSQSQIQGYEALLANIAGNSKSIRATSSD
jgi:CDP-glucose 4,6-dehydratase